MKTNALIVKTAPLTPRQATALAAVLREIKGIQTVTPMRVEDDRK